MSDFKNKLNHEENKINDSEYAANPAPEENYILEEYGTPEDIPVFEESEVSEYAPVPAYEAKIPAVNGFADTSKPKKKRRYLGLKIAGLVLGTAAVIVASSLLTVHLLKNSDSDDGFFSYIVPDDGDDNSADTVQDSDNIETDIPIWEAGDGTVIGIASAPDSQDELSLQDIYKKCLPSVVYIIAETDIGTYAGTGVILSEDGYVATNQHVIAGANSVTVRLYDDTEYEAYLVGGDSQTDLAVLKIDARNLTPAEFGDSQKLEVGDKVVVIGNPLSENFRGTMTDGIISAIDRDVSYGNYSMTLLQTNAAINSGNSGGPLINMYGQVIGITNMKMVSYYSSVEGIGFAIPSATAVDIINQILANGEVVGRPGIGITVTTLNDDIRNLGYIPDSENLPDGVYVDSVYEGTDAYEKGILAGDVIVKVNGTSISNTEELNEIKNGCAVGDVLTFTIYRDGKHLDIDVALCDMNDFAD